MVGCSIVEMETLLLGREGGGGKVKINRRKKVRNGNEIKNPNT